MLHKVNSGQEDPKEVGKKEKQMKEKKELMHQGKQGNYDERKET